MLACSQPTTVKTTDKQFGPSSHLEAQDDPDLPPRILPVSAGDRTGFRAPKPPSSQQLAYPRYFEVPWLGTDHIRPRALA